MGQEPQSLEESKRAEYPVEENEDGQVSRVGAILEPAVGDEDVGDQEEEPGSPPRSAQKRPGRRRPAAAHVLTTMSPEVIRSRSPRSSQGERQTVKGRQIPGVIDEEPAVSAHRFLSLPEREERQERRDSGDQQECRPAQLLEVFVAAQPDPVPGCERPGGPRIRSVSTEGATKGITTSKPSSAASQPPTASQPR